MLIEAGPANAFIAQLGKAAATISRNLSKGVDDAVGTITKGANERAGFKGLSDDTWVAVKGADESAIAGNQVVSDATRTPKINYDAFKIHRHLDGRIDHFGVIAGENSNGTIKQLDDLLDEQNYVIPDRYIAPIEAPGSQEVPGFGASEFFQLRPSIRSSGKTLKSGVEDFPVETSHLKENKDSFGESVIGYIPETGIEYLVGMPLINAIDQYFDGMSEINEPSISDVKKLFQCGNKKIVNCVIDATAMRVEQIGDMKKRSLRYLNNFGRRVDYGFPATNQAIKRLIKGLNEQSVSRRLEVLGLLMIVSFKSNQEEDFKNYTTAFETEAGNVILSDNEHALGRIRICSLTTTFLGKVRNQFKKIDNKYCAKDDLVFYAMNSSPNLRVRIASLLATRGHKKEFRKIEHTIKRRDVFPNMRVINNKQIEFEIQKAQTMALLGYSLMMIGRVDQGVDFMWKAHETLIAYRADESKISSVREFLVVGLAKSGQLKSAKKILWQLATTSMFSMDTLVRVDAASSLTRAVYAYSLNNQKM
jgi:hypothetical protein